MAVATNRTHLIRVLYLVLSVMVVFGSGCGSSVPPEKTPPPLFWSESDEDFWTNDVERAEAEIHYSIILPSYVPGQPPEAPPAWIRGPLKRYQNIDIIVDVFFVLNLGRERPGVITISEGPTLQGLDPELNPGVEILSIRGETVSRQGGLSEYSSYYFKRAGIGVNVHFERIPADEAIKVVDSMLA